MTTKYVLSFILAAFCTVNMALSQTEYVNASMKVPSHPRIILLKGQEKGLLKKINKDPYWKDIHQNLIGEANRIVDLPTNQRIKIGRRLLSVSRENLRRIFDLSYAYRMTKNKKFLVRAEKEMLAAANFSDWNPSHFLDVGEMTMALAIGYDWLYNDLSETSRTQIRQAIIEKGLKASYNEKDAWFLTAEHNWNQVCNGGITFGALAVYEDNTAESLKLINRALNSIQKPMNQYAPGGAYPEGIGYWDYGTSFNMMFLSAIEGVYKTDFDLSKKPGFLNTGMYSQEMITPFCHTFNYSDNGASASFCPTVFWFYSKTKNPALLYMQKKLYELDKSKRYLNDRLLPIALIYGAGSGASLANPVEPSDLMWTAEGPSPVAVMRSSWSNPEAAFLGFKLGSPSVNHAHLDVGSFVFEADGVRWAIDFGGENYERLESRGVSLWGKAEDAQRWDVFRYRTKSHNTLTFNDKQQSVTASAKIDDSGIKDHVMYATSDLSAMYKSQIPSVKRTVSLVDKKFAVIEDELTTNSQFTKVRWNMLTEADKVTFISKNTALLEKDGKKLYMKVDAPIDIRFYNESSTPTNTYDSPNVGNQFVGFEADLKLNTTQKITVYLLLEDVYSNFKP